MPEREELNVLFWIWNNNEKNLTMCKYRRNVHSPWL